MVVLTRMKSAQQILPGRVKHIASYKSRNTMQR